MIVIVLALLIAVVGASVILIAQNWSPVLPLIIFGQTTVELPLALWILSAILAGVVTSVVLQGLNYLSGSLNPSSRRRNPPEESSPPVSPRPPRRSKPPKRNREPEPRRSPAPEQMVSEWELEDDAWVEGEETESTSKPQTPEEQEWATKQQEEDWDLDKPPREQTIPALKRKIEESINRESLRDQSSPQQSQRVAEYQQRKQQPQKKQQKRVQSSNQEIYDAQYRVINPPQQPPPENTQDNEENKDEDWI
jgi:uncharacterized integral membrane protein